LEQEPVSPRLLNPSVPRDLETVCLKCLEKEPHKRYGSAQELAEELERFLNDRQILARPAGPPEKLWRWCRRRPALAALIAALHLVGGVGLVGILWQWGRAERAAQEALVAQHETTTNLWNAYLAQAGANRRSGRPGQRFATLEVIGKASAIRPSPELRDEAVAALALVDARRLLQRSDPDGEALITAFDVERGRYAAALTNGEISIRLADGGREVMRLPAVGAPVAGVERFSSDGRRLLAVYQDHRARVWELEERRVRLAVPVALAAVSFGAALTEDGRFVAAADDSPTIGYYAVDTELELASLTASDRVSMVSVTRQGERLAAAQLGGTNVDIFALPSGQRLVTLAHPAKVRKVCWDPEGRLLAIVGADREIRLWNSKLGTEHSRLRAHNEDIEDVVFGSEEGLVISSGWDGTILWNHETGERRLSLPEPGARLTMSADGRRLYRQGFGKLAYEQWELAIGTTFRSYGSSQRISVTSLHGRACAFSRDRRLLAHTDSGQLRFLDPLHGRELGSGRIPLTTGLALDADLNLWAGGQDGLKVLPCRRHPSGQSLSFGPLESVGPGEEISRLRLSADGSTLAVIAQKHVRVFDVKTRSEVFATPENKLLAFLALSPEGKWLATAAWGAPHIEIWNVPTGELQTRLQSEAGLTSSSECAFSPDGRWLVTVGLNGCVMWEAGAWKVQWARPRADLPFAVFSPDNTYVVQRGRKSFLELLATDTGEWIGQIESPRLEHLHGAAAVFSPDGAFFAVHSTGTSELFVWHLAEVRRELARLGLDWDLPPLPTAKATNATPLKVEFVDESRDPLLPSPAR
jgi:WD40 repeat protein